ncbi:hypothetical protein BaOVIS_028770 [Babesia ovis]|uniref:Uncharacterized protein n=1 Tax=Babesia ovis TaxID=5869 RepID=A0A9W5TEA4_BABOV|nr:hypothetical protein BaOVIS_028770 [Babesia ovis]
MACVEDSAPSGRSASTLEIQEVLGEQFTREVEFMQLRAIEIDKCHTQAALQLTEVTRKATLPNNLQYLRMCKSIDNNRILLIYGTSADIPCRGDLESRGINIYAVHTVEVPKYSPCTTEQYRQWSKYWPLKYLKPKVTPVQITHALKEKMLTMMSMVVQESQRENNRAVCIITYKDRTIAKAIDERGTNILNHAALLAVRQVAKSQQNDPKLMVNAKKRYTLIPPLHILGALKRLHISYSNKRLETADIARRLVIYTTGDKLKLKFPQLYVTWEILDYDAPASMRVEFLNGKTRRFLIEGYSKPEKERLVTEWQFKAKLEPWPETLAPTYSGKDGKQPGGSE